MIVGMTDETQKPKRKRWRWIIAGVLLFMVAVGGWWYWPRGDARFVGQWSVTHGTAGTPNAVWTFQGGGVLLAGKPGSPGVGSTGTFWRVEGEHLVLGSSPDGVLARSLRNTIDFFGGQSRLFLGREERSRLSG
jgi:hypothetical protein